MRCEVTWKDDDYYEVKNLDNSHEHMVMPDADSLLRCDCEGFFYNKKCSHVTAVKKAIRNLWEGCGFKQVIDTKEAVPS
jgi:hypothetical protein